MEKKGLSRLRAFVCLAAVSRPSGLAVLPVCCRDPLPPPGLPTALLHAQTQTQGCHLEAKHTCRVVSRDVIWSKKTIFLLYMSIWANQRHKNWKMRLLYCKMCDSDYILFPAVLCGTPPAVENAHLIGRRRSHYDIHAVVRYQCAEGFFQRHIPTARCRADGSWERPKIICTKCECSV